MKQGTLIFVFAALLFVLVSVPQASLAQTIPDPVLVFSGTESYTAANGNPYTRYRLSVSNWQLYPPELFVLGGYTCGTNTNASRTWVDIYTGSGESFSRIYGFCGLSDPQQLTDIWFALPQGQVPEPEVYVVLTDKQTGNTYSSNVLPILMKPVLAFLGTENYTVDGTPYTRYRLSVSNWQLYPQELFVLGGYTCGENTNASRTWVDIYTGSGESFSRIYGFCALSNPQQLTDIWFALPQGQTPEPEVYVVLTDNQTGNTFASDLLPIGTAAQPSGYPPISLPLNPGGSGGAYQVYEFDNNNFNFGVNYPEATVPPGIKLVVQPILISQSELNALVDGSDFDGATLVPYNGTGGYGVLFRITCEDADNVPVECPAPGTYDVKTGWNPTGVPIVAPAYLKAPIGTNGWEDILLSFYEDKIDPTGAGRTCCHYSDFVFVDMAGSGSGKGTTLPTITITSPVDSAEYTFNQYAVANYSCSGAQSCVGTVATGSPFDTWSLGTKSFDVSATVDSESSANPSVSYVKSVSYSVAGNYNIRLLYDADRSVKKGATYPIKLQVHDIAGNNLSAPSIVLHAVNVLNVDTALNGPLNDSGKANANGNFRFDSALDGGGYIYNLSTKGLSSGAYNIVFTVNGDPTPYYARFNVK